MQAKGTKREPVYPDIEPGQWGNGNQEHGEANTNHNSNEKRYSGCPHGVGDDTGQYLVDNIDVA